MNINELKLWLKNQVIFNDDSLLFIKEKIIYMEAILNLLNKVMSKNILFKIFKFLL